MAISQKTKLVLVLAALVCGAAGESFAEDGYVIVGDKKMSTEEFGQKNARVAEADRTSLFGVDENGRALTPFEAEARARADAQKLEAVRKEAKTAQISGTGAKKVAVLRGHRYYLFLGGCATWEEARVHCESLGGHLATVENKAENFALYMYVLNEKLAQFNEKNRHPYLGLYYEGHEWKWVDGSPVTYTKWYKGKSGGSADKPFARMNPDKSMMRAAAYEDMPVWEAASFQNGAYLCEWDEPNEKIPQLPEVDMLAMLPMDMRGADAGNLMATTELMSYEEMQKKLSM